MKTMILAILSVLLNVPGVVQAESICDVALKSGAFNTSDFSQTTSILMKSRDEVCKSEYDSASEAVAAAQQSGGNVGYGGLSVGLSDVKATSSGKYSVKDSKYCSAKAEELDSYTSVRARQQIADSALNAWSKCVESTTRDQLFIVYKPLSDGTGMTASIRRKVSADSASFGTIEGIATSATGTTRSEVSCRIGTQNVRPDTKVSIPIDRAKISMTCGKPAQKAVSIALIATVGDQEWMHLETAQRAEQIRVQTIQDALNAQKRELEAQSEQTSALAKKVSAIEATNASLTTLRNTVKDNTDNITQITKTANDTQNTVAGLAKFRWKTGNNGTASCDEFCRGEKWPGGTGRCFAAFVGDPGAYYPRSCSYNHAAENQGKLINTACLCLKEQ